jgi:hypothetical protein
VNRNFTQTFTVRCDDPADLIDLVQRWDINQATFDVMGYIGSRILADRDQPGVYTIEADFGVVDPEVSAFEEAQRNNDRPETQEWAARLRAVVHGEPEWRHYDEIYRTGA